MEIEVAQPKSLQKGKRILRERSAIDKVIGKPPKGEDKPYRDHWYEVCRRYNGLKPSSRGYLIAYMECWNDIEQIDAAVIKSEETIMQTVVSKVFLQIRGLRKDSVKILSDMAIDINRAN